MNHPKLGRDAARVTERSCPAHRDEPNLCGEPSAGSGSLLFGTWRGRVFTAAA
jgi:hypothetical protein